MSTRSAVLWLCAWAMLGCAVASAADPRTAERVWTDQLGRQVTAKLIRVERDVVYLDLGGRVTQMPFDKLSAADQRFLAAPDSSVDNTAPRGPAAAAAEPPLEEPRVWTIGNRQVAASFAGADEEAVYLKGASGDIRLAYDAITSREDAVDVAGRLRSTRPDLANLVVQAYERNTGNKFQSSTTPATSDDEPMPPVSPVEITGDPPVATEVFETPDDSGKQIEIATADKALAAAEAKHATPNAQQGDVDQFRNRAMLGGFALVAIVAAVLGFSWLTRKRKEEE